MMPKTENKNITTIILKGNGFRYSGYLKSSEGDFLQIFDLKSQSEITIAKSEVRAIESKQEVE